MNAAADLVRKHRLTAAEFERMAKGGVLDPDVRSELIDGEIFDMPPIGERHQGVVDHLQHAFITVLGTKATVRGQGPIVLGEHSMPQPDLAVLRWRDDFYVRAHPRADDVLLVVEVAHSSLGHDERTKRPLYARHALPEYWLVDVEGRRATVYRDPSGSDYRESFVASGPLALVALPGVELDPTLPFA